MNEIEIPAHLRHPNLISLYYCTSRHCHELLLVYECIPNGTVADHLHDDQAKLDSLSWTTRMSTTFETASSLAYLHASDVIHRNVKISNILLDNSFCIKVANFGLSRLFPTDVTHVSTTPQGTPGYVDLEYYECYQLTDKSAIYNFGVVLIKLISSKPTVDITRHRHKINLSNMAINKIQNHELHELVDPCLGFISDYKVTKMIKVVAELAFQCLQNESDMRPSMKEVLEVLKEISSVSYDGKVTDEMDIPADDVVLLKSDPPMLSPNSLRQNWVSRGCITSNAGGS
ncbi:LEAF RUST 10 DISEASE-RESISTANCE LOCUS RECEPTOR-LIKE PROTEIN KINASE-like 1.3 [Camellia lanceoleosa]|uniref:LEAF RUST 10 DISEASE-RESISTANCE LOCUS RECEPTOR-LIKE PROTEIN KINASE-like 1.3 n=1 Tax=Camellia lanceoleosa TaxID=1840588 RepID=A0ACC0FBN6_9ERIC|nr:LEAF RUST 10 DISEASE-RESISTANCE LOCUS RECEPTOR-LIKE PROTEIN KINASE-like 1.3 [Camellia lanceoleosa]